MNSVELRRMQEPLKKLYRNDPRKANITLRARSKIGEGISCRVETGKALATVGLHPATGGDGSLLCSGDMLLEALSACAGVTLKAVATAIDFDLRDATIIAEGELDFRGTLAVNRDVPVGFGAIRLRFELDTLENQERIDQLVRLTERYCVVYQTLLQPNRVEVTADQAKGSRESDG